MLVFSVSYCCTDPYSLLYITILQPLTIIILALPPHTFTLATAFLQFSWESLSPWSAHLQYTLDPTTFLSPSTIKLLPIPIPFSYLAILPMAKAFQ